MKITIDIDCSPKEARQFLGLPDIEPLQEAFIAQLREKMSSGLSSEDMEKMFNLWMAPGLKMAGQSMEKNMETLQNIFWNAASATKEK